MTPQVKSLGPLLVGGLVEFNVGTCYPSTVQGKIATVEELKGMVAAAKSRGKKIVFTNGCFDLLHLGHLRLLREAKRLGDLLVVALNSDGSVKQIKGPERPIFPENERAELIASLEMVDYVTIFEEADPKNLLSELKPDVLVKGGDWPEDQVVGKDAVERDGGRVVVVPYLKGHSTTAIIERMRRQ